jgi:hypothetical protein
MKRATANLPLHGGKAPAYLFKRMKKLAGAMTMAIVDEYGPEEMLRRLSDPWWFQAFGCVLGYDWHSSGLTTVTCGALREASKIFGDDLGIIVAGGKGRTSRKTPQEIDAACNRLSISGGDRLIHASRMSAKVDSAALQDGYQVYHHSFLFTPGGSWCVIQQGMNDAAGDARRYHWLGQSVSDFVCEPHRAVEDLASRPKAADLPLLNMVAAEADANRRASASLVRDDLKLVLDEVSRATQGPTLFAPRRHPVLKLDVNMSRLEKILRGAHEQHPADFAALLGTANVGPATVRSLSLIAELIHGAPASHRDPADRRRDGRKWADYSYAHGGKDGTPFPVDRETYDRNINILLDSVRKARLGQTEKSEAIKRLGRVAGG